MTEEIAAPKKDIIGIKYVAALKLNVDVLVNAYWCKLKVADFDRFAFEKCCDVSVKTVVFYYQ